MRILQRIAFVLSVTFMLFATLTIAGQAHRLAIRGQVAGGELQPDPVSNSQFTIHNSQLERWGSTSVASPTANVSIAKTGPTGVSSGDRITYTIRYRNDGPAPAANVVITDTLPAGITYAASGGDLGPPSTVSSQQIVWQTGTLSPTGEGRLVLIGQVDPEQPSYSLLTNTVTISTQTPESDQADNVATSATGVQAGSPDSVQLSVPVTPVGTTDVTAGTSVTFTARVLDRWSNPVAGNTPVTFAGSARITPDPSALTVGGVATATLRAGTETGPAIITATAGTAVSTGTLEVVPGPIGALHLTASPNTQTAGQPVELHVAAFDGYRNPARAGVPISFTTRLGEVQPPIAPTDVAGTVTATLVSTRTGATIVSAHSADAHDSAMVLFTPGPLEQIIVAANPPAIPVDGTTSRLQATLADHYGNPVDSSSTVTFASSLGTINPKTTAAVHGQAATILTSGSIHGQSVVTATTAMYTGTTPVDFLPADLRIESTHSPDTDILPGTAMTYTITYTNTGHAIARNVVITDTLPAGLVDPSFQTSGATLTPRGEGGEWKGEIWDSEDLSPGEGGTIILRGHFDSQRPWPPSQFVSNIARIASTTAEGNPSDNSTSSGHLILTANLFVQSSIDEEVTELRPGRYIKYLISAGNYGPAPAQGLIITDTLPVHTSLLEWRETGYQPPGLILVSEPGAPVLVWRYDSSVAGPNFSSFYILLRIDPETPSGALLRNQVEVHTETPESDYTNNVDVIESRLTGVNLEILARGPDTITPGRRITYTLRYTNTGTHPAENVTLIDSLPAGVSMVNASRTPDRAALDRIEWDLGRVESGTWGWVDVIGRVEADVVGGTPPVDRILRNTATITTTSTESFTADNTSAVSTRVVHDVPARLTLAMTPTTMTVGTTHPLSATITDQFGNLIAGQPVTLTTTVGRVAPPRATTVGGVVTATFEAPLTPTVGSITAASGTLSDTIDVAVEPGPPAELRLEASVEELPADGQSTTLIQAHVWDEYGNLVADGTPVVFETDHGVLGNGESRHVVGTVDGVASTALQPGRSPGTALVTARAGPVSSDIPIAIVFVEHSMYLPLITRF